MPARPDRVRVLEAQVAFPVGQPGLEHGDGVHESPGRLVGGGEPVPGHHRVGVPGSEQPGAGHEHGLPVRDGRPGQPAVLQAQALAEQQRVCLRRPERTSRRAGVPPRQVRPGSGKILAGLRPGSGRRSGRGSGRAWGGVPAAAPRGARALRGPERAGTVAERLVKRCPAARFRPRLDQGVGRGQLGLLEVRGRQVRAHGGLDAGVHEHRADRAGRVDADQADPGQVGEGGADRILVGPYRVTRPAHDVAARG